MQSGVVTVSDSTQRANGVKMVLPIGGGALVAVTVGLFGIGLYAGIQGRARWAKLNDVNLVDLVLRS